jgi:hypothetical protein
VCAHFDQAAHQGGADEARSTGDEDLFSFKHGCLSSSWSVGRFSVSGAVSMVF